MTTLTQCTSTIAWRTTTCTEPARIVSQSLMITLTLMAQVLSAFHKHLHSIHVCGGCFSLIRPAPLSTSSPSSCPFSFPSSSSSTSSCSQNSSTRRTWKTCAIPRRTRVRTLTTSSTHPQVKNHHGSQDPWKSVAREDRSGRLDKGTDTSMSNS